MLTPLIRFSIRYYGIIITLAIMILVYGCYRFQTAGLDIFPNFAPKQVIIHTESTGLSAEQVELLVTQPIEKALSGLMGLVSLRSESIQGLSVITVIFAEQSDIYRDRQQVSERLSTMGNVLPPGVHPPVAVPLSSASATVLTLGIQSDQQDLTTLRSLVDWTIVPRLLSVAGVADVNVFGGAVKQLQIQVHPTQLQRFKVSLEEVIQAAEQAGSIQGGGFIETQNQRFTVTVSGLAKTTEQFKQIIVQRQNGDNITLGDVADIQFAAEAPISAAQIMGKPGIVLMVIGQYGANTLAVSRAIEQMLRELDTPLKQQAIHFYPHLFRPADYIETSIKNLSGHLLIGAGFVVLVLYLFLFNLRSTLIAAVAIPVSLAMAVCVLLEAGVNLNIMVLGGLAIALGEVVDDAIIDTENIFRRLRENRLLTMPLPTAEVVYHASIEVRSSVVYASFIVALVFVPLLTLSGVAGRLFAPLGYAYIVAILMSLLVALTLTPALCYGLLSNTHSAATESPLIRYLKPYYAHLLNWVAQHFKICMVLSVLASLFSLLSFSRFEQQFLPELREGHYMAHTTSLPGTSLAESIRIGTQLTEQFRTIAGVASVSQWAGRAERGADTYGSHYSEYEIRLKPLTGPEQQQVQTQLRAMLNAFPGINFEVNTFLMERVNETLSGYTAPIVINVYGNDLDALDNRAQAIAHLLKNLPDATDIQLRSPPGTPLVDVQLDLAKLNHYGLRPSQIQDILQTAFASRVVGKNYDGNKLYSIAVTLPPAMRSQLTAIEQLPLRSLDGQYLTLAQVANVQQSEGRYNILHEGAQRRQTITCNLTHQDLARFLTRLKHTIAQNIPLPKDMLITYSGAAIEQATAKRDLWLHAIMAGAEVLILIFIAMGNARNALLTLCNLPFAFIGGVLMVLLTHTLKGTSASVSVGSVVGFITLFGITVRNSIMLLSHYQHLVEIEGKPWNTATAIQGAQERLPSILMTALVTALAMLPIAFNSDNPGREIMGPMAAIIIGGLLSSTSLNLLLLPVLLVRSGRFQRLK